VEARATATPCVTSDYGAMPEVVDDAGLIVPCDDDEKLAAAIIKLLRDVPLSTQLGLIGRKRYEERYNWDSIWQIMHAEIESGLAESA
jgi:glycosyltransferase involved in cell wall biosynthesis